MFSPFLWMRNKFTEIEASIPAVIIWRRCNPTTSEYDLRFEEIFFPGRKNGAIRYH